MFFFVSSNSIFLCPLFVYVTLKVVRLRIRRRGCRSVGNNKEKEKKEEE